MRGTPDACSAIHLTGSHKNEACRRHVKMCSWIHLAACCAAGVPSMEQGLSLALPGGGGGGVLAEGAGHLS